MSDNIDTDPNLELFHELRTSAPAQKPPSIGSAVAVASGLVIGLALIVTAVVLWGQRSEEEGGEVTPPDAYVCAGEKASIVGTDEDDVIEGTPDRDVIHAGSGDDVVRAFGGDDIVCGGAGDDELRGGAGDDIIRGEAGVDACVGGPGENRLQSCEGS